MLAQLSRVSPPSHPRGQEGRDAHGPPGDISQHYQTRRTLGSLTSITSLITPSICQLVCRGAGTRQLPGILFVPAPRQDKSVRASHSELYPGMRAQDNPPSPPHPPMLAVPGQPPDSGRPSKNPYPHPPPPEFTWSPAPPATSRFRTILCSWGSGSLAGFGAGVPAPRPAAVLPGVGVVLYLFPVRAPVGLPSIPARPCHVLRCYVCHPACPCVRRLLRRALRLGLGPRSFRAVHVLLSGQSARPSHLFDWGGRPRFLGRISGRPPQTPADDRPVCPDS